MNEEERFERALETLLVDRSPHRAVKGLTDEHRRMLRIAQLLRGSRHQEADVQFIEGLRGKVFPTHVQMTRRRAILSSLATLAAGIVAGLGIERAIEPKVSWTPPPLVGARGRWVRATTLSDLPDGAIQPFSAGAVRGIVIRQNDRVYALSRICTHMGCVLDVNREERTFECPCHGAEFDLQGRLRYGPRKYGLPLPPLPRLRTRIRGETVEVFGV